jgi:hypothetical protein
LAGDVKDRTQVQSRMAQQRTIRLVPAVAPLAVSIVQDQESGDD